MLSYPENIPVILRAIKESGARRILDVGGGMGKYALLAREQDLSDRASAGDMSPNDDLVIDCCEDTEYFTSKKHHDSLYNNHFHTSVFDIPFPNNYDLILFIDTVEHWDKNKTKDLFSKLNGRILVSTPTNTVMYTDKFYGDDRHHQSQWQDNDFVGWNRYPSTLSYIYLR